MKSRKGVRLWSLISPKPSCLRKAMRRDFWSCNKCKLHPQDLSFWGRQLGMSALFKKLFSRFAKVAKFCHNRQRLGDTQFYISFDPRAFVRRVGRAFVKARRFCYCVRLLHKGREGVLVFLRVVARRLRCEPSHCLSSCWKRIRWGFHITPPCSW